MILLSKVDDKKHYRDALVRLFPRLDAIWGNTIHGGGRYDKDRRIASPAHFQTYFRMSIDPDAIPRKELAVILDNPSDTTKVSETLREAVKRPLRNGSTRAKAWLDALVSHGDEIPIEAAEGFLRGVFAVADEVNVDQDQERGWSIGDNSLRVHWLIRRVLRERTTLEERSQILLAAAEAAPIAWLGNLTASVWEDHHPREGKERASEEDCLLTEADADRMRSLFLKRVTDASADGTLISTPDLIRPIYLWLHFLEDDKPVREWMAARIEEDASLVILARELTSQSWGHSSEDLVSVRSDRASVSGLDKMMDPEKFRANLVALQARLEEGSPEADTVGRFLIAWKHRDEHGDW